MRRKILRVALLTLLEPASPGASLPRAFLRIGGISVARQQLGLALALHCERIVCIAHALDPDLVELQHAAERTGAQFNVITAPRQLMGLVTTVDEVIALGDGLFVSVPEAAHALEQGQAVLVQPIEQGLAAGFERIDINHASAAAMRIPGRLVERIAELPSDCDANSALQRIALQSGVRQRAIPAQPGNGVFWTLVRSEDEAHALEPQWIRQRTRDDLSLSPARGLALLTVRTLGPAMLHAGSGAAVVVAAAGLLVLLALGAGWFGLIGLGLSFCAAGWVLRDVADLLARVEGDPLSPRRGVDGRAIYGWLIDAVVITLAGWSVVAPAGSTLPERYFPALVLVGLLRLLPRALAGRWTAWLGDRALLALALAITFTAGVGLQAIHLSVILLLGAGILLPRGELQLTQP